MPGFVSQAQRRKWEQLLHEGRVTQEQFDARAAETEDDIPERAKARNRTVGPSRSADAYKVNDRKY